MPLRLSLPAVLAAVAAIPAAASDGPPAATATSPNGQVVARLSLDAAGVPSLAATFRGREMLLPSPVGVDLADGTALGAGSVLVEGATGSISETYDQFPGKRRKVRNSASECVVTLKEKAAPSRRWQVVLRAYDDGVAYRYRFPAQEGWDKLEIARERTGFRLPYGSMAHAMPVASFTTPHEARYLDKVTVSALPEGKLLGLPVLIEVAGAGWMALAEADLTDYAGLYLVHERGDLLRGKLSPIPGEPRVAVRSKLPHESPWRVAMVADRPERLVESDLILNLNKPNAIGDTSWIKPGMTTFPWWNGFFEAQGKVPFKMGLNTETAKYYIDFCAEAGIPYHSLDGLDNIAWYGGTIVPYTGGDITRGIDGLDLEEVIKYAKSKGVKLRLWMHWQAAEKHMDRAFPLYKEWGIEGVMVDFLDRDDQAMSHYVHRLLRTAAANHLTVTIHNTKEPTGLERTYPNLLTHEGVMNYEFNKWDKVGIPPEHDLTAVFTRMLAGPMDFHQGTFRGVPVDQFAARDKDPLVMGTPCRMLASYVVFQDHLPMAADYPSAYRGHPLLPVLTTIPCTWDETKCLAGSVGEYAVIAPRSGDDWWVGGMSDRKGRTFDVKLDFLGPGRFEATTYRDEPRAEPPILKNIREVGAEDTLTLKSMPAGGFVTRISPR